MSSGGRRSLWSMSLGLDALALAGGGELTLKGRLHALGHLGGQRQSSEEHLPEPAGVHPRDGAKAVERDAGLEDFNPKYLCVAHRRTSDLHPTSADTLLETQSVLHFSSRLDPQSVSVEEAWMPTNEDRLRWVVNDFARAPLTKMSGEALEKLSDQLRQFYRASVTWRAWQGAIGSFGFTVVDLPVARVRGTGADRRVVLAPFSVAQLVAVQRTIRGMLARLVDRNQGEVAIPQVQTFMRRMTSAFRRPERGPRRPAQFQIRGETKHERVAILVGFLELIRMAGGQLYACPVCQQPFVAHLRQEYCSKPCSQKVRNAKRRPRKGGQEPAAGRLEE